MERDTQVILHYLAVRKILCEAIITIRQYLNTTSNNRETMLELEDKMYRQLKRLDEETEATLVTSMSNINSST